MLRSKSGIAVSGDQQTTCGLKTAIFLILLVSSCWVGATHDADSASAPQTAMNSASHQNVMEDQAAVIAATSGRHLTTWLGWGKHAQQHPWWGRSTWYGVPQPARSDPTSSPPSQPPAATNAPPEVTVEPYPTMGPTSPPSAPEPSQSPPAGRPPPTEQPSSPQPSGEPQPPPASPNATEAPSQPMCNAQTLLLRSVLIGGQIVDKLQTANAIMCCQCCLDEERCNAWAWCDNDAGQGCFNSRDSGWRHPPKTCLLKMQARLASNPSGSPTVLMDGGDVPWTSGLKTTGSQ